MAKPQASFLHQYLLTKNLTEIELVALFCALSPEDNGTCLSLLYLKCVDSLTPAFKEHQILEKVIEHLNKIKVPDPLYKATKALKLKMIRECDSRSSNSRGSRSPKAAEEEKGFMNFLNDT